jgi:hypothetical protein
MGNPIFSPLRCDGSFLTFTLLPALLASGRVAMVFWAEVNIRQFLPATTNMHSPLDEMSRTTQIILANGLPKTG